jgi:diguanylate cyclase
MEKVECKLLEKIKIKKGKLTKQEAKDVMNIVRQEMSFMVKNNILMTPKNYERWFNIFCYLEETRKKLTEPEIIGLFKETYGSMAQEEEDKKEDKENSEKIAKKLNDIAEVINGKLVEAIKSVDEHNTSIATYTENITESKNEIKNEEILASVNKILFEIDDLKQKNGTLTAELKKYHEEIKQLENELKVAKKEAAHDFLTGLVNRRRFERALEDMLNDLKTRNYPSSLVLIDIDNFKKVNDTYGHPFGDVVLQELAKILKTYLRANAIPARVGGEEFAVLLPGDEVNAAAKIADRLRKTLANRKFGVCK